MRIAAKRLRYTLELFAPLYGSGLKPAIAQVKKIQEQLGEIHDADVLVPALLNHLRRELAFEKDAPERGVYVSDLPSLQGLLTLCKTRKEARESVYRRFLQTWTGLRAAGFFDGLWIIVINGKLMPEPIEPGKTDRSKEPGGSADDTTKIRRNKDGQTGDSAPEGGDETAAGQPFGQSRVVRRGRKPRVDSRNGTDPGAGAEESGV